MIFIKGNISIYFSKCTMIPFRWKTLNNKFSSYFNSLKSFCEMSVKCPDIWYFCLSFTSSSDCASTVQLVISLALPVSLQSYKNIKKFPQNISFFFTFHRACMIFHWQQWSLAMVNKYAFIYNTKYIKLVNENGDVMFRLGFHKLDGVACW